MDPVEIGNRIREIRKRKNIVLKDLSDLFSIGKWSNIERGKVLVSLNDIKKIAERLDVPLEEITGTPESESNIAEEVIYRLSAIRSLIIINDFSSARKLLKKTKQDIKQYGISYLIPEIHFYYGLYHLSLSNHQFARTYLINVTRYESHFEHTRKIKIRALNALCFIEYINGNLLAAWEYCKQAVNEIGTFRRTIEEESYTYFNAAIVTARLGNIQSSSSYIQTAYDTAKGSFKMNTLLVLCIIKAISHNAESAKKSIVDCIDYFSREDDVVNLIKSLQIAYFISGEDILKFNLEINDLEKTLINFVVNEGNNKFSKKELIRSLHVFVVSALQKKQFDRAKSVLEITKKLNVDKYLEYRTVYLEAKLIRLTTKDKQMEEELLEQALKLIGDRECFEKAIILHELHLLRGVQEGILFESNQIFYRLISQRINDFDILEDILPLPRY